MKIVYIMVAIYISCCIRLATRPCKYFQLNARFFDAEKGIFSKIATDSLIPAAWRLAQEYDDGKRIPEQYPVFIKPEWSQNAAGVQRADNAAELCRIRAEIYASPSRIRYLLQQGAMEAHEYEIFYLQHHRDTQRWAVFTITQACNSDEPYPVNGIYNPNTQYVEITDSFSAPQLLQLWTLMRAIGQFPIARISVRANSMDDLLKGKLHVIEVNLFLPMPINLLDDKYSRIKRLRFVAVCMFRLALATKHRERGVRTKPVFTKIMLYNRSNGMLNYLRARL